MASTSPTSILPSTTTTHPTFTTFNLDHRLQKALKRCHYTTPTPIQQQAIPHALQGRDLLIQSKTGSGKTVAYAVPVLQHVLNIHQRLSSSDTTADAATTTVQQRGIHAIVMVPTRELVAQVHQQLKALNTSTSDTITLLALDTDSTIQYESTQLKDLPSVVISTPTRLYEHCKQQHITTLQKTLSLVIIDEADLILSYGFDEDIRQLLPYVSAIVQTIIVSATLTEQLHTLQQLILHNPLTLQIDESLTDASLQLAQLYVDCSTANEKFLLVYSLLKLGLIRGKILFFVNSVDTGYRLKLLLQQFGITSLLLNTELPFNSRQLVLQQYNRGLFDYLIATDEGIGSEKLNEEVSKMVEQNAEVDETTAADADTAETTDKQASKSTKAKPKLHSGVVRGIDFQHVNVVVNYDFAPTPRSYTHRIGRTSRAGQSGLALSLITPADQTALHNVLEEQRTAAAVHSPQDPQPQLKQLNLNKEDIEGFRYRVEDVSRQVTQYAVREARLAEIRQQLLHSTKLKAHFEDNPRELELLKKGSGKGKKQQGKVDAAGIRIRPHLQHVPDYLIPSHVTAHSVTGKTQVQATQKRRRKDDPNKKGKGKKAKRPSKNDPLLTFTPDV